MIVRDHSLNYKLITWSFKIVIFCENTVPLIRWFIFSRAIHWVLKDQLLTKLGKCFQNVYFPQVPLFYVKFQPCISKQIKKPKLFFKNWALSKCDYIQLLHHITKWTAIITLCLKSQDDFFTFSGRDLEDMRRTGYFKHYACISFVFYKTVYYFFFKSLASYSRVKISLKFWF